MSDADLVEFMKELEPEDAKRLHRLISILRRIDSWCAVNRVIGRWFIFTILAALIIVMQGYDALVRVLGAIRGH